MMFSNLPSYETCIQGTQRVTTLLQNNVMFLFTQQMPLAIENKIAGVTLGVFIYIEQIDLESNCRFKFETKVTLNYLQKYVVCNQPKKGNYFYEPELVSMYKLNKHLSSYGLLCVDGM